MLKLNHIYTAHSTIHLVINRRIIVHAIVLTSPGRGPTFCAVGGAFSSRNSSAWGPFSTTFRRSPMTLRKLIAWVAILTLLASTLAALSVSAAPSAAPALRPAPRWASAAGFDVSPALRDLATQPYSRGTDFARPEERGPFVKDRGFAGDGALQQATGPAPAIPAPLANFEGL